MRKFLCPLPEVIELGAKRALSIQVCMQHDKNNLWTFVEESRASINIRNIYIYLFFTEFICFTGYMRTSKPFTNFSQTSDMTSIDLTDPLFMGNLQEAKLSVINYSNILLILHLIVEFCTSVA